MKTCFGAMSPIWKRTLLRSALRNSFRSIFGRGTSSSRRSSNNPSISRETIELLERLSLVKFNNEAGIKRLESAIRFADQLREVDTTDVEPLYSVQENRSLYLRADVVTELDRCEELLRCSEKTLDDCFIAPPGNIPLSQRKEHPSDKDSVESVNSADSV